MAPVTLRIPAPPQAVWRVVGERWGEVHRILPSLSASRLVTAGAPGPGSARVCTLAEPLMGIAQVEERVTAWEEGRSFTYVFDRPPWPIGRITNTWVLRPDGQETLLTLGPSLTMRGGPALQWLSGLVLWAMSRRLQADLAGMVEAIARESRDPPACAD